MCVENSRGNVLTYEHHLKVGSSLNVVVPLFLTCIFIIIVIKLSFIARLNKKHLAQKRATEESLVVSLINFEQVVEDSFAKR